MNHALLLNAAIILVILAALWVSQNPIVLLGLFFLRDMPYGLVVNANNSEEEPPRSIGFTADIQ